MRYLLVMAAAVCVAFGTLQAREGAGLAAGKTAVRPKPAPAERTKPAAAERVKAQAAERAKALEDAKAAREAKAAQAAAKGETADKTGQPKPTREHVRAKLDPRPPEAQARLEAARETRVDARQANQEKRIQHGIAKGYLTSDEVAKLQDQQKAIADLENALKSDGKLSRDDMSSLRTALNEASRCIWAEKHDTEGNQMPVYRLGKNVFAKDSLTQPLAGESLSGPEARAILKDFRRTLELRRILSTQPLNAEHRAKLQEEYDALLNKYFEVRTPAPAGEPPAAQS